MRILLFAYSRSSLGHVVRMCSLGQVLQDNGHKVSIACHSDLKDFVKNYRLNHSSIYEIEPTDKSKWGKIKDDEALRKFVSGRLASKDYLLRCFESESLLIEKFLPDIIISDMRNTAGVSAALKEIPCFSVHNLYLFCHPLHVILPEVISGILALNIDESYAKKILGDTVFLADISKLAPLKIMSSPIASLLCSLVNEIKYVGPVINFNFANASAWQNRNYMRKKIVISLGGSDDNRNIITKILKSLDDLVCDFYLIWGQSLSKNKFLDIKTKLQGYLFQSNTN